MGDLNDRCKKMLRKWSEVKVELHHAEHRELNFTHKCK